MSKTKEELENKQREREEKMLKQIREGPNKKMTSAAFDKVIGMTEIDTKKKAVRLRVYKRNVERYMICNGTEEKRAKGKRQEATGRAVGKLQKGLSQI